MKILKRIARVAFNEIRLVTSKIDGHVRELAESDRREMELVQALTEMLDHIWALNCAANQSGNSRAAARIDRFSRVCTVVAERTGLKFIAPEPGQPFDGKLHRLSDGRQPATACLIVQTVALGYSFRERLIRPALVTVRNP